LSTTARHKPFRHRDEREEDREKIAALYLKGWTLAKIATEMGFSRTLVHYDLSIVRKRWRESAIRDFDELRTIELQKIDNLEAASWEAWEKSCQTREKKKAERLKGAKGGGFEKTSIETLEGLGDPRFLDRVAWCINRRCELLGLDAPKKIAPTTPDGEKPYELTVNVDDLTEEELNVASQLYQRFVGGRERVITIPPPGEHEQRSVIGYADEPRDTDRGGDSEGPPGSLPRQPDPGD
jgi:hypothetical protein